MDTTSATRIAQRTALRYGLTLTVALAFAAGCKTPPVNPFLQKPDPDEVTVDDTDTAAKSAEELAAEVKNAFKTTADQARLAATQTVSDAAQRGRQVATDAAATADSTARSAAALAQVRAIEATSAWPIEQAGPVLLVALTEGGPVARRAAANQLAERWPPAVGFPVDSVEASRAAAVAELRKAWVKQYGEINDQVAAAQAHAQQVVNDVHETVDQARQVAYETRQVAEQARDTARQVRDVAVALQQADLPETARRTATAQLQQFAHDASAEVRAQTAQAAGEIADQTMIPLLIGMLDDQIAVQQAALDSLTRLAGEDVAAGETTVEARARRWQLWYQDHPQYRTTRK